MAVRSLEGTPHVEQLGVEKLHPVFLLDEAHLLHQDMLDHLHILLNYQWDSRALLSRILVGLPELESRLVAPAQPQPLLAPAYPAAH
ncbi:ATP-binding protein [Corallococcus carmarthensis]|uniref:ATP-binding protein n=1 Tax=Corallococcus carmarthensis TaxID=2316728 RepID=UPI001FC90B51|nr:ATP-binding protein [Corallococcus carmarthensis]